MSELKCFSDLQLSTFQPQAQNHRELGFKKGDLIYIRRQVDGNWYEGERNAMIGILPVSYVEIVPAMDTNTLQSRWGKLVIQVRAMVCILASRPSCPRFNFQRT